jgi:hypothetical protein
MAQIHYFSTAELLPVLLQTCGTIKLIDHEPNADGSFRRLSILTPEEALALVRAGEGLGGYEAHGTKTRIRKIRPLFRLEMDKAKEWEKPLSAADSWQHCWRTAEAAVFPPPPGWYESARSSRGAVSET